MDLTSMLEYTLYDRDLTTGHLKPISVFDSPSDFQAASIAKRHAAGRAAVLYQDQRSIMYFAAAKLRLVE